MFILNKGYFNKEVFIWMIIIISKQINKMKNKFAVPFIFRDTINKDAMLQS